MCIKMIKVQFQETSFEYFLVIEYDTRRIACQKPPELTPHHTHTHTQSLLLLHRGSKGGREWGSFMVPI